MTSIFERINSILQSPYASPEWVVAGLLVLYFAQGRFNTPPLDRSSTTWLNFHMAQAGYMVFAIALFAVLASSPQILSLFLGGAPMPEALKGLSAPLVAGLIMTTLLPRFPALSSVDEKLLRVFQDMGEIPTRVHCIVTMLVERPLTIDDESRKRLTSFINRRPGKGVVAQDLDFTGQSDLHHQFTRLLHLHLGLRSLKKKPDYAAFSHKARASFETTDKAVENMLGLADKLFPLYRQLSGATMPPEIGQPLDDLKRSFQQQFEIANNEVAELVARAILWSESSEAERRQRLRGFGLAEEDTIPGPVTVNRVIMVMAMIYAVFFIGIMILSKFASHLGFDIPQLIVISGLTAVCFGSAVVAGLWPKRRWSFTTRKGSDVRPIGGYIVSGLAGALATALIGLVYKTVTSGGDVVWAVVDTQFSYPWYIGFFAAAFITAWLCDNAARDTAWIKGPQWRLVEAGIAALVMLISAWVACEAIRTLPGIPTDRVYPFWYVGPLWFAAGVIIGFCVPHWYRRAPQVTPPAAVSAAAPVPAAQPQPA